MKIAILGSGPAGLFAAHAAAEAGHDFQIFSLGKKSHLNGAQYLHEPIPGLTLHPGTQISYRLHGTVEEYRQKVYQDENVTVSPEILAGDQLGWDIRDTYDVAWERYSSAIADRIINRYRVPQLMSVHDLVISTIPARRICDSSRHRFLSRRTWAIGDAPALGVQCPVEVAGGTVVCDGRAETLWYRASNIFGFRTVEWPFSAFSEANRGMPPNATLVEKPISTDCDCWGDKVLRMGRYGAWNKTELSHMAFYRTREYLNVTV